MRGGGGWRERPRRSTKKFMTFLSEDLDLGEAALPRSLRAPSSLSLAGPPQKHVRAGRSTGRRRQQLFDRRPK